MKFPEIKLNRSDSPSCNVLLMASIVNAWEFYVVQGGDRDKTIGLIFNFKHQNVRILN